MAILKQADIEPNEEQQRQNTIGKAIAGVIPKEVAGIPILRGISPLVMEALRRANNPYITGKKGFEAANISFDPTPDKDEESRGAEFAMAMMGKTAEVLACFSCSREELKEFAFGSDQNALKEAVFDIMENATLEQMAEATVFVSVQLKMASKARADKSPDDTKPKAETIESEKKRQRHTGSRKS